MKLCFALSIALVFGLSACSSNSKKNAQIQDNVKAVASTQEAKDVSAAVKEKAEAKVQEIETAKNSSAKKTCTKANDVRVLEVKENGKGCELLYTKNGTVKTVATSKKGLGHCTHASQKIEKSLVALGMVCQ